MFVWIALIPILLLGASFWSRAHQREVLRSVDHTREVQVVIQDLLISLADAEIGRRGFVATGDAKYTELLEATVVKSASVMHRMADLTQDNPVQQRNIQELERLVNDRFALLKQTSQFGEGMPPCRKRGATAWQPPPGAIES